jgi:hypothetical protein
MSKMFVINTVNFTTFNLLSYTVHYVPFSAIIQFFVRTPKCPGPGIESR